MVIDRYRERAAVLITRCISDLVRHRRHAVAERCAARIVRTRSDRRSAQAIAYDRTRTIVGRARGGYPADERRAEDSFRRAIETARAQEAKSFELRAAVSLAEQWRVCGKRVEARKPQDRIAEPGVDFRDRGARVV